MTEILCVLEVSQMQRMINQIGGQMDNLELRDRLYVLHVVFLVTDYQGIVLHILKTLN